MIFHMIYTCEQKERKKIPRELIPSILGRKPKMCNFIEWRDKKIVYKRFVFSVSSTTSLLLFDPIRYPGHSPPPTLPTYRFRMLQRTPLITPDTILDASPQHTTKSRRYASLYFCMAIGENDNELITLEVIHRYVELLDKYFGSVCELDIIFNYEKASATNARSATQNQLLYRMP